LILIQDVLPSGASIAHLSIKTPKDNDWFAQGNVLQQTQNLDNFGERLRNLIYTLMKNFNMNISIKIITSKF
jgi:hypothetical protein